MNKKILSIILAVFVIASMLLAACQPATPEPTKEPEPEKTEAAAEPEAPEEEAEPAAPEDPYADVDPSGQTVYFWYQHTRGREEALQEIIEEFNATNEFGITVDGEYQGGYNDIFNKMLAFLNTDDAPDLVVAYQNQAATYQLGEGLLDMNPLVDSPKWGLTDEDKADFFQGFYNQDVFEIFGGQRLGFPPNRSMEVLFYNKDWLEELGFDAPPQTPEEFKEMACAASEQPFSKATVEGNIGYEWDLDASNFAAWTFARGGDVFDYNTSQYKYNDPAAVEAMEFMQGLFDSGCAELVAEKYGDDIDFGTGKLLFEITSTSGLPFIKQALDEGVQFDWSIAPIPFTTAEPVQDVYGASVSMPHGTPESELATWLFLKYYTSPEVQAKWAMASNYFPVRQSVAEGLDDYFAENQAYEVGFDMLKYGYFEPPVPGYDFVRDLVAEAMAAIANGADVQSTLDQLTEEANVILGEQLTSPLPTPVPSETPEA